MRNPLIFQILASSSDRQTRLSRSSVSAKVTAILLCVVISVCGCGRNKSEGTEADSALIQSEEFHADNDIAMVVRSIADAISVGERLDSAEYNYNGVLTDGQGTPLYTDVQGAPGAWEVDVVTPEKAVIRNLYLGDLLPKDLEMYLTQSLDLDDSSRVETDEFDSDDEAELSLYEIPGGELRFETRAGIAPNGLEGPLMSIVIAKQNNKNS